MSGAAAAALAGVQFIPGLDVIVDVGLVVAAVGLGAFALSHAYNNSHAQLKDSPQAHACADCGNGPDCFEPPDRNDPEKLAEFRRQLKGQQDGINKLSPDQVMETSTTTPRKVAAAIPGKPQTAVHSARPSGIRLRKMRSTVSARTRTLPETPMPWPRKLPTTHCPARRRCTTRTWWPAASRPPQTSGMPA